jgi:hypothetical protein
MDFGAIIKAPMDDKDWIKKILLMGVFMLIPVVGPFNLLGYMKAVYENRKAGKTELPDANLSYIVPGLWVFVAFLPLYGALIVVVILMMIVLRVAFGISPSFGRILSFAVPIVYLVMMLGIAAAGPAILYVHVAKGERWASLKVGAILALIKGDIGKYVTFWLICLVASIIGGAGSIACGLGMFLTMPLFYAIVGVAIADFEKLQA